MIQLLTPAGEKAVAAYDPFRDDPTFRCDPVAIRRVWGAPGTPLEIVRDGGDVVLHHEWMDVRRVVHMNMKDHPKGGPRSSLGHSIGHLEGDTLVIETANYSAGVLNQYVEQPGQPTRGLLHSAALTSVERLHLDAARQRLVVEIDLAGPRVLQAAVPARDDGVRAVGSEDRAVQLLARGCDRHGAKIALGSGLESMKALLHASTPRTLFTTRLRSFLQRANMRTAGTLLLMAAGSSRHVRFLTRQRHASPSSEPAPTPVAAAIVEVNGDDREHHDQEKRCATCPRSCPMCAQPVRPCPRRRRATGIAGAPDRPLRA